MRNEMRQVILLTGVLVLSLALIASAQQAQPSAVAGGSADISLVLVKQTNGKPVRNATIVLHPLNKEGKQENPYGINLKSDADGKAEFRGLSYGKCRIQVIARGFQTFGEDFVIEQPKHEFTIKLAPPKEQYSIYK